ncbi:MAG: hypothetical protein ACK51E_11425 [Gemmatimonadota bacterium]|jgi:phage terminase Nu1 subunit (DNA packaging protein)|nr:terminase small subunit [Gemmatimonadota bacterium]
MPKMPKTLRAAEAADAVGVSPRTLREWTQQGCPHRRTPGGAEYVIAEVLTWRTETAVAAAIEKLQRPDGIDLAAEQARKARADADLRELDLAERRGELVPVAKYRRELEDVLGRMRAVVSGGLHRFERRIVSCATPGEARRLTRDIEDAICRGGVALADTLEDADPDTDG